VNAAVWNFNSGTTRTWYNSSGQPLIVEFHNDDHYDRNLPVKSYPSYTVSLFKAFDHDTLPGDPGNEDVYAGFSIGTGDSSALEFGDIKLKEVVYVHRIGSRLKDFPREMGENAVHKLIVRYEMPRWNRYWMNLGLELGIASVTEPALLLVDCPATGYRDTLMIDDKGKKFVELGGAGVVSFFDISLSLVGKGSFTFDNFGVPSLVQIQPTIELDPWVMKVNANSSGDTLFHISNLGGSDMFWTLTESSPWFEVGPATGVNDSDVILAYQANSGPSRTDSIRLDAPAARNSPQYIVIKQDSAASFIDLVRLGNMKIDLFPNPNPGAFTLTLTGPQTGPVRMRIVDIIGRVMQEKTGYLSGSLWQTEIQLPGVSAGSYFVQLEVSGNRFVQPFIIRRDP
jgi:hypothetical protein